MNEITISLTSDEWLALWRLTEPQESMNDVAAKIVKDFLAAQQSFAPDPETGGAKSDNESTPAVSGR